MIGPMRTVKIVGIAFGALIAVVVLALLAVWLLVNPNDYKPQIAAAVKRATGRELMLEGNLKLSVFPWIALELGSASLGNPPGFPVEPFVAFKHASVRVKLAPLLAKRLEVGRVELDGLDLKLLKNKEGKGNWAGFGRSEGAAPAPDAETPSGGGIPEVAGFKITNARVSYEDLVLENLALETGSLGGRVASPVTLHVDAHRGTAGEKASLDAHFELRADSAAERYSLNALALSSAVTVAGNPKPVRLSVSAPAVDFDLKAETVSARALQVNAAGVVVNASLQGTKILDAMDLKGAVKVEPVALREVLPPLGVALPKTRDAKALSRFAASGDYTYGKNSAQFENLEVILDDTHLKGSLGLDTATEAVKFALTLDTLDLDRYLPPPSPAGAPAPAAEPQPKAAESESKPLDANGTLSVGSLHFAPLNLSNVKVTVATNDRVMHIYPLKAQVNGGDYSGDITLDRRAPTPVISMDEHLSGIDVAPLVAAGSKTLHVTGRGNVNLKATARGVGADATLKTLNGRFDANIANGAVEGIDLGYELGLAEALIRHGATPAAPNTRRTQFTAFKLSADIGNGVAQTHDLLISSAVLKVTGQGSINLPPRTLDVSLLADTLQVAGNTPIQVPVKVTGSLTAPTVRPDLEALAKSQVKQKLQNVLQDKLKGLFGKP
jgi:AsmA protein